MAFRQYAERVLFGASLEDKLALPETSDDTDRGQARLGPISPSRPPGLALANSRGHRVSFPKLSELDDERARGRVLHFFANHELLALELMALALLRFPDAPDSFRRRLVVTMRDEQRHMRLYLERMRELGVELGEIPLNSFFWDLLSSIERPIDFVVGMSMTFEQANLDYSCHFRDAFGTVGDDKTKAIMETVLADEVAHVRHGVQYFDGWRDPSTSQWDVYQKELAFPLTPARAKGIGFTVSHRRAAGIDDDFIERLRVYSHSKGRPPKVFLFNPGTELALACGQRDYTPPAPIKTLARDLESLPMFLMAREDSLLVRHEPAPEHLRSLLDNGYSLPEFLVTDLDASQLSKQTNLSQRPIGGLLPWGWDPAVAKFLQPLAGQLPENTPRLEDIATQRALFASKAWLTEKMPELIEALPAEQQADLVRETLPALVHNMDEAQTAFAAHRERGYERVVFKAPYGTAGHAAIRGRGASLEPNEVRWIQQTLESQGSLIVEPWYQRQLDFSYLFEIRSDGSLRKAGFSRFFTDSRGGYRGALLGPLSVGLPPAVRSFLFRGASGMQWLQRSADTMLKHLHTSLVEGGFRGRAGIDMMVVRDLDGQLKLRAPLELNPRPTLGHVALGIRAALHTRTVGLWLLVTKRDLKSTEFRSFPALLSGLQEALPTRRDEKTSRLSRGVFSTNEASWAEQTFSVVLVAPQVGTIWEALRAVGLDGTVAAQEINL